MGAVCFAKKPHKNTTCYLPPENQNVQRNNENYTNEQPPQQMNQIPKELVSQNEKNKEICQSNQDDSGKQHNNSLSQNEQVNKIQISSRQPAARQYLVQNDLVKKSQEQYQNTIEELPQQVQQNNEKQQCYQCINNQAPGNLIVLQCGHQWHEECIFQYIGGTLKLKCKCGVQINREVYQKTEYFDKLFESQLFQMSQYPKNHLKYCRLTEDCTFIYFNDDDDQDTDNKYCPMCSTQKYVDQLQIIKQQSNFNINNPKQCYCCKSPLFTFFIEINKCNHKYHLLCAQQLIKDGKINQIQCICGQELNQQTKQSMMIQCIKCEKYDDSLKLMDCMHYIHYNCLDQYADEFSDFQCCECQFSIASCLEQSPLKLIKEKLSKIQEEKQQQQWLDPNFCIGCFRNGSNLILLQCKHSYHEDCLQKMMKHKAKCANPAAHCRCGVQVKDQNQYISRHPVNY